MKVCVGFHGQIVIKHNVDSLNVQTTRCQVCGNQYPRLELLELVVGGDAENCNQIIFSKLTKIFFSPIIGRHIRMQDNRWKLRLN